MNSKQEVELLYLLAEKVPDFYRHFHLVDVSLLARTSTAFNQLFHAALSKRSDNGEEKTRLLLLQQAGIEREVQRWLVQVLNYIDTVSWNYRGFFISYGTPSNDYKKLKELQKSLQNEFTRLSKLTLIEQRQELLDKRVNSLIAFKLDEYSATLRQLHNYEVRLNQKKTTDVRKAFIAMSLFIAIFMVIVAIPLLALAGVTPMGLVIYLPIILLGISITGALVSSALIHLASYLNAREINKEFEAIIYKVDSLIYEQDSLLARPEFIKKHEKRFEIIKLLMDDKFKDSQNEALLAIRKRLTDSPGLSTTALFRLIREEVTKPRRPEGFFSRFFYDEPKDEGDSRDLVNLFKRPDFYLQQECCQVELIACLGKIKESVRSNNAIGQNEDGKSTDLEGCVV